MKKQKKLVGRRLLALLLTLTMLLGMVPVTAFGAEEPVEISDANGLRAMASTKGSYQLTADIELPGDWTPIVSANGVTLDGNGYTITLNGQPLFRNLYGSDVIKNLILKGTVSSDSSVGALTNSSGAAAIRNCLVYTDVTYTGTGGSDWAPHYVAGIVGSFTGGGSLKNCLYAGTFSQGNAPIYGALANLGFYVSATIGNSIAVGSDRVGMAEGFDSHSVISQGTNTIVANAADFLPESYVDQMNQNTQEGDLTWILKEGTLALQSVVAPDATEDEVDALKDALEDAEKVDTSKIYEAEGWNSFASALERAEAVAAKTGTLKQREVVNATSALTEALDSLRERSFATVDISGDDVISITSADQLEYLESGEKYRLDSDITISGYWFGSYNEMNAILDGNGHTIQITSEPLWDSIGPDGVIQNLGIIGEADLFNVSGAIAKDCSGLIINCWTRSEITSSYSTSNVGNFIANLKSGGAIINSYAAGTVDTAGIAGGLTGNAEENTLIQTSYWQNTIAESAAASSKGIVTGSAVKIRRDFYSDEFLTLLNNGKGTHGKTWNHSSDGYPYFGVEQSYEPDAPMEITYNPQNGGTPVIFSSETGLTVSLAEVSSSLDYKVGTLSAEGAAHWNIEYRDSTVQKPALIADETGELYIYLEGSVEVTVCDSNWNLLARFPLTVSNDEAEALRFSVNGEPIEDGRLTVQGSEVVTLVPEILLDGSWRSVASTLLTYEENGNIHRSGSTIYAEEPGTMTLKATGFGQETTVEITSEYVPVTSIRPAAGGTYVIHGRNANSNSSGEFLDLMLSHGAGTVIVEPENASYRNKWTLESSDTKIAEYMPSSIRAILPKKAGTVVMTAISNDPNLTEPVTGTSQITLKYRNPLTDIIVTDAAIRLGENETIDLPLTFVGSREAMDSGYEYVTEPQMVWNFESRDGGQVEISRSSLGFLTGSTNPDEYCMANPVYKISGLTQGTVVVTGTPLDQTNHLESVTFTVIVGEGEGEAPADNDQLTEDGIRSAQNYLLENIGDGYVYGNEWEVFSLIRSGKSVETNDYLDSVEEKYTSELDETGIDTKPTTIARVAVALGTIGVDASDFREIDLIEMLYSSNRIGEGGNEPMWALIAMDSRDYAVPENAKWTRDKLVSEILTKYQNAETGAFGLNDNVTTSIDMTAMALQALAPYYEQRKDVADAVDKALEYLKGEMNREGGYGTNVEAAAQVLTALTALGIDPTDMEEGFAKSEARNLITNIMSFKVTEGNGFKHTSDALKAQNMSSVQALYSLESYRRLAAGENVLFDLTDVNPKGILQSYLNDAESLKESDYTESGWKMLQDVIKEARAVLNDPDASEDELLEAAEAIAAAITALEPIQGSTGNRPEETMITVSFRLVGDTLHEKADTHVSYITWIKTFDVSVPKGSTVYDVFEKALEKKGLDFVEGQRSYISSIKAPKVLGGYWLGEFDNGPDSGWKYLVNGEYPNVGLRYYWLEDGDSVVWRYVDDDTDDYDAEDKWEEAEDAAPSKDSIQNTLPEEVVPEGTILPFTDVETDIWYRSAVEFAYTNKLFSGVSATEFGPNVTMNRAMLVTVLHKMAGNPEADTAATAFGDVGSGRYYSDAVKWAVSKGLVSGYSDGNFGPSDPITRQQLAFILWNYSGKPEAEKVLTNSDADNISNYAKEAMQWAVETGVMSGRANGQLDPKGNATRAEVAQMLKNYIEKVVM